MFTNSSGSTTAFNASRTLSSAIGMLPPLDAIILAGQGPRLIVAKPYKYLLARHLNVVGFRRLRSRHHNSRAGLHVEFGSVAWAGDRPVFGIEWPIAQRSAIMCTHVVERVEMARCADQHHESLANLNEQLARIFNFARVGDKDKIGHSKYALPARNQTTQQANRPTEAAIPASANTALGCVHRSGRIPPSALRRSKTTNRR